MEKRIFAALLASLVLLGSTPVYASDLSLQDSLPEDWASNMELDGWEDMSLSGSGNLELGNNEEVVSGSSQQSDDEMTIAGSQEDMDALNSDFSTLETNPTLESSSDSGLLGKIIDNAFEETFTNQLNGNQDSSVDDFFAVEGGVSIGDFQYFDLSGTALAEGVDLSVLNLQYACMAEDMLSSQVDLSGASQSATELFYNTYGDILSQISLETPEIPEDFSSSSMVELGQKAISSAVQQASSSQLFTDVKNNIGLGNLVSTVKNGMTGTTLDASNLASYDTLKTLTALTDSRNKASMYDQYSDYGDKVENNYVTPEQMQTSTYKTALDYLDLENNISYLMQSGDTDSALSLINERIYMLQNNDEFEKIENITYYVESDDVYTEEDGINTDTVQEQYDTLSEEYENTSADADSDEIIGFMAYMASEGYVPTHTESGGQTGWVWGSQTWTDASLEPHQIAEAYAYIEDYVNDYDMEPAGESGLSDQLTVQNPRGEWESLSDEEKTKYVEAYNQVPGGVLSTDSINQALEEIAE